MQCRETLAKKAADLEKKRRLFYGLASRSQGKKYEQNCNQLTKVMKLIENVHSDAAVLNEHISEFKNSRAFAHVMQVLKDDFVLIPSGGNGKVDAVLKEKEEISFSDMLQQEKLKEQGQLW